MSRRITIRPLVRKNYKDIVSLVLCPFLLFVADIDVKLVGHFTFSMFPFSASQEGGHGSTDETDFVMLVPVRLHAYHLHQGIGRQRLVRE